MSRVEAKHLQILARDALCHAGTAPANAECVAEALVAAELDGLASHGLSRLPAYADQAVSGKVDGAAVPRILREAAAAIVIDAGHGFAYPAIDYGLSAAIPRAREAGACVLAIAHSHHAGVLGHHVERIAEAGLIGLGFTNSPAAIAPWGGSRGLFGTNPIAFAAPRTDAPPMVIDLSLSRVARGKVMLAKQRGEPIPQGWALDREGQVTTDAQAALDGTMVPAGEAKGAALALMVEILAAALTGSSYGYEASSFFEAEGAPPDIGQSFMLIDPERIAGPAFGARLELLLTAIAEQPGARIPGARRHQTRAETARDGVEISTALLSELRRRAEAAPHTA
ncbi:Ldh family oxidoreductase [Salinisphaera aquimarina]|uniref:Ldh family oxidoreductase n=1 Tax=Salinisphaera aquimarina TaxID=2094031 RepID=A0ABV7EQQ9_9GAMM